MFPIVLLIFSVLELTGCTDLKLISSMRTSPLENYQSYLSSLLIAVNIPKDTSFVAIQFTAEELDLSYFVSTCSPRNVSLYMKYGAPPVINPDGSKFPSSFKNITREKLYDLTFLSDKSRNYINITSPLPGQYMAVVFLSYQDPKYDTIKQQGLSSDCQCFVESKVYLNKTDNIEVLVDEQVMGLTATTDEVNVYKFSVPNSFDQAILILNNIKFSDKSLKLVARVNARTIPSNTDNIASLELNSAVTSGELLFTTVEGDWHYLELYFHSDNKSKSKQISSLTFKLRYFSTQQSLESDILIKTFANRTEQIIYYNNTLIKQYKTYELTDSINYKQYALVRDSASENFLFSYLLEDEVDSMLPVALNLTDDQVSVMKFQIHDRDVGGTAQFMMAFKPKVNCEGRLSEEPANHVVVACIRPYNMEIPTNPGFCQLNGVLNTSPLILNETLHNASVLIPFPETGQWYASFRLFCDQCVPCECPDECKEKFTKCMTTCYKTCTTSEQCNKCDKTCASSIDTANCITCAECDGPCKKSNSTCQSSVLFDISSAPCVGGSCGVNGRCAFMISSGIAYSSCVCLNNYRGWDCSDDFLANPLYMVIIELLLLVLSNLAFLPSVYFAYRRKYYTEAVVYFSICFFSTFYHACDAGENLISFCIARKSALQFADFFCALFAFWVTLIAIADLPPAWPSLFHIVGAILIAFFTTIDKTSLWVFLVPSATGVIIVIVNWSLKYRKVRQLFCKKNYIKYNIPLGGLLVAVGLCIYTFLQTTNNYKYLHSLWHVLMAVAVIIMLPKEDTFQPDNLL